MEVLGQTKKDQYEGDFVLQSQTVADKEGFKHVSKLWYDQTMSYEDGLDQMATQRAQREDIYATVQNMAPAVDTNGRFVFRYADGREFTPTEHALKQVSHWSDTGTYITSHLQSGTPRFDKEGSRDQHDAETLQLLLQNGFRRLDQDKKFLFRTYTDGTLRAMMTETYFIIDNEWFLDVIKEAIPGGRLSHWRGDADTIYGNVLIPDTIRAESDSDYGGMLSVGNSEIGIRRLKSLPSVFRAICMNGCIWDQIKGQALDVVHRKKKPDLKQLKERIIANLINQIPLLPTWIDTFLESKSRTFSQDLPIRNVLATVAKTEKFSKRQATSALSSYSVEPDRSLFGVVNSLTRAGQELPVKDWLSMDEAAGRLIALNDAQWDKILDRSKSWSDKDLEEVFI